ncbi:uncharacterized protein E0L32_006090 [Thyridium curvatum]|uniref:Uncharacterized protein n=1 Tax=Thyridium curvatum TaxID=1093900 RepID=A0A507B891_9PEZI|nr:uncharacterized protein E0L32_006090 [Thyridium curvatum]TPX13619.1 hypothetical protein E0L32_006090 [Thyridium curvatum]
MKVALVTASSAGLGAAIARCLAPEMRVVINYASSADRAAQVKAEMEAIAEKYSSSTTTSSSSDDGPRFGIIQADLGKRGDIERLVAETIAMMGRLDVVVSNGGWTRVREFRDLDQNVDEEDWDRCFDINVKSHLHLLHTARKYLDEAKGAFVTIASTAGVKPSGSSIPYAVTKAAQIHMVKCLAQAVGPNIRVNSVSPGLMMTDWAKQFPQDRLEAIRKANPLQRVATVEDVAETVKMVVNNSSMTGQNTIVDAGFSV